MSGVAEERKLDSDETKSKITFTSWISEVKNHMETCGMDTVFRVVGTSTEGTQETYLLEDWAAAANKTLVD